MPDPEIDEELVCTNAILAAVQLIQKKCGGKSPKMVELDRGVVLWVPNPLPELKEELPCEDRVLAVAQSDWALGVARGLATKLFGLKPGEPGYEEAVKKAAIRIAIGAVPGCEWVKPEDVLKRWTREF